MRYWLGLGLATVGGIVLVGLLAPHDFHETVNEQQAQGEHVLPIPSFPPLYVPPVSHQAVPVVTVSPCPAWAPTLIYHVNGDYYECLAQIPPDPQTGPLCEANGRWVPLSIYWQECGLPPPVSPLP